MMEKWTDATGIQTGYQLCHLFAMILEHCIPTQPVVLWERYKDQYMMTLGFWWKGTSVLYHQTELFVDWICVRFQHVAATDNNIFDYGLFSSKLFSFNLEKPWPIFHQCLYQLEFGRNLKLMETISCKESWHMI